MGKGDKKTRRGKIFMGSYGVRRPRKKSRPSVKPAEPVSELKLKDKKPVRIIKQEPVAEPVTEQPQSVAVTADVPEVKKVKQVKKSKETVAETSTAEEQPKSVKTPRPRKEAGEAVDAKEIKPAKEPKPKKVKKESKEE